ncbi:MAG: hypothetical protein RR435_03720 [Erysipelotrichaceae bacterium]
MKKIVRIFPIIVLVILNILIVLTKDMQQKETYKNFESFNMVGFTIPDNTENIKEEQLKLVYTAALSNDVVLIKTVYNENNNSIDSYVVTNNLLDLMSKQLDFDIDDSIIANTKSVATYKKDDPSSYYVRDLLNNDRYAFYKADDMRNNHIYRYGTYSLYYKNEDNCQKFFNEAAYILNTPKEKLYNDFWGHYNGHSEVMFIAILFSFGFFILFYFILVVFLFYRNSKKIGVLLLLGYSKKDVLNIINKKYFVLLTIISVLLCSGSIIILPNTDFRLFISMLFIGVLLIVLTCIVSYLALLFICKYTDLSNILKKQSIVQKVSNACLVVKFIMVIVIILFTLNVFPMLKEAMHSKNILEESKLLMDYAVFPRIKVENTENDDYDKYLKFYKLIDEKRIDHFYVRFDEYLQTDEEIIRNFDDLEKNGQAFRTASVDLNYLDKFELNYFDDKQQPVAIKSIKQEFYLIPQSKKDYEAELRNITEEKYTHYNISNPVLIYYYQDYTFDTYDSVKGVAKVASPIIRVVHEDNPYTYMQKSYGLDIAGTGMNTALKFKITNNENLYQTELLECINEAGLSNVLSEDQFVSYKTYYADEIANSKKMSMLFYGVISIALLIYIALVIQTFVLFIDARKNEILVKSIMGFSRKEIFLPVIGWNIGATMLPISGILAFTLVSNAENLITIALVSTIFLIIDISLILIITKFINLNNVYSQIKGE